MFILYFNAIPFRVFSEEVVRKFGYGRDRCGFVLCHVTYIVPNTIRVFCHVSVLDVRHFPPAIPNSLGLILPRGFFPTMLRGLREMTMYDRKKMHFI